MSLTQGEYLSQIFGCLEDQLSPASFVLISFLRPTHIGTIYWARTKAPQLYYDYVVTAHPAAGGWHQFLPLDAQDGLNSLAIRDPATVQDSQASLFPDATQELQLLASTLIIIIVKKRWVKTWT